MGVVGRLKNDALKNVVQPEFNQRMMDLNIGGFRFKFYRPDLDEWIDIVVDDRVNKLGAKHAISSSTSECWVTFLEKAWGKFYWLMKEELGWMRIPHPLVALTGGYIFNVNCQNLNFYNFHFHTLLKHL